MTKIMLECHSNIIGLESPYIDLGKGIDESIEDVAYDIRDVPQKKKGDKKKVRVTSWKEHVNVNVVREIERKRRDDEFNFWLKVCAVSGFLTFLYWSVWRLI